MAASKRYFTGAGYRFLPTDQHLTNDPVILELQESEVWNSAAPSQSPESPKQGSRISIKPSAAAAAREGFLGPVSMPVNVPDWSKILKNEYRENPRKESDDDEYEDDDGEENGNRIPPHEFLARTRIASFSVHEGFGRTLKGRDLSRVRNAIWQKIGLLD